MTPLAIAVSAAILCTPANYDHSPRCTAPVESFVKTEHGFYGQLVSGVLFTQKNISNELGVRLQKFEMEQLYWYVSDKGIIKADSDIEALSKYLSM